MGRQALVPVGLIITLCYTYVMSHGNENNIPHNGMRAEGEQDRTDEYKAARDSLILSVRGLLDDVERRQADGLPLGTFGTIHDTPGVVRTVIEDPFAEPTTEVYAEDEIGPTRGVNFEFRVGTNLMAESTKPIGVYFYRSPESGQRNLVVVRPDKVVEIVDNPLEQQVAGPEAGYTEGSSSILASFNEKLPDGSYVGAQVRASGKFSIKKFDGENGSPHIGISLSRNPEQIELVSDMWADIEKILTLPS